MTENVSVAGSRPASSHARSHTARRSRALGRGRVDGVVLVGELRRQARAARLRPPPMMIGGCGRCTGFGQGVDRRQAVVLALERERAVGPCAAHDRELLLEHLHARAQRREGEAVRLVLALVPAGAEAELDAAAGDVIDGGHGLGEHGGMTEGRRRDEHAEPEARRDRRQAGQRRPGLERAALVVALDREVVIRAEQRAHAMLLAGPRERDPLRPGHVLLALDHQLDSHAPLLAASRSRQYRPSWRRFRRRTALR